MKNLLKGILIIGLVMISYIISPVCADAANNIDATYIGSAGDEKSITDILAAQGNRESGFILEIPVKSGSRYFKLGEDHTWREIPWTDIPSLNEPCPFLSKRVDPSGSKSPGQPLSDATTIVSPVSITIGGSDFGINITKAEERGSLELTPDFIMRMKQIVPASGISSGFRLNIADSGDGDNVFWIGPDFTESSLLKIEECPFLQLTDERNKMPGIASANAVTTDGDLLYQKSSVIPVHSPVDTVPLTTGTWIPYAY